MDERAEERERNENPNELVIDAVLSTQPELGPSIPDGGYGWIIFLSTLYFQFLIPSISVSFGIFLMSSSLKYEDDRSLQLWDDNLLHVPLFFSASWTFFDPPSRKLIAFSTWPRLIAAAGICLTCAGLLLIWIGMTGTNSSFVFILAGLTSGMGASILISQCEILLAQYFRLKLIALSHITQAVTALGFIIGPVILGHHVLHNNLFHITLWYQAIILWGLVVIIPFKKPMYLKSRQQTYNYVSTAADDEEDILSKSHRELQIKRQNSNGVNITEKHEIPHNVHDQNLPSTSGLNNNHTTKSDWETFDDNSDKEAVKDWETFEDEDEDCFSMPAENSDKINEDEQNNWVSFQDELKNSRTYEKYSTKSHNSNLHLSFAEDNAKCYNKLASTDMNTPLPLFSDLPVNNNNTYSFDADTNIGGTEPNVFDAHIKQKRSMFASLKLLKEPTFYKSLLMVVTTKFSIFVFFTLFPKYLYETVNGINLTTASNLVGALSTAGLLFSGFSYWLNVDKSRRPIVLFILCWLGAMGYFLLEFASSELAFLIGAVEIVSSIATLKYVGMPLLSLTIRGEMGREYGLLSYLTGLSFSVFLIINFHLRHCFRLMAMLHFITGLLWIGNFIYKTTRYIPGMR